MAGSVPSFAFLTLGTEYPGARSERSCFCCAHIWREHEHCLTTLKNLCVERLGSLNAGSASYSDAPMNFSATVAFQKHLDPTARFNPPSNQGQKKPLSWLVVVVARS